MMMLPRQLKFAFVVAAVFAAVLLFAQRGRVRDLVADISKPSIPSAMPYPSETDTPTDTPTSNPTATPTAKPSPTVKPPSNSVNLDIPFVSQAPHKNWDIEHEDFCEEAAALMVASYVRGDRSVTDINVAEAALQRAKEWEISTFGYFESTTAVQTAQMLREHFGMSSVKLVTNPTQTQIKEWVTAGKAVIVPSAGRQLGNPNFTGIGPLYHMLVVKGYTADGKFITNDPGTRKGADYLYAPSVIMDAMHDWNNGDVSNGAKVVIVVG